MQGKENDRLVRCVTQICLFFIINITLSHSCSFVRLFVCLCIVHLTFVSRLFREQERYLQRIQELESALARMGEEAIDKATLLETAQSDKETISR